MTINYSYKGSRSLQCLATDEKGRLDSPSPLGGLEEPVVETRLEMLTQKMFEEFVSSGATSAPISHYQGCADLR